MFGVYLACVGSYSHGKVEYLKLCLRNEKITVHSRSHTLVSFWNSKPCFLAQFPSCKVH
jgi:hypothetical protein